LIRMTVVQTVDEETGRLVYMVVSLNIVVGQSERWADGLEK